MDRPESGIVPASLIQYVSFCLSRIDTKPTRSRVGRHRTSLYQLVPRATQGRLAALTAMDPLVACSGRSWRVPGRVWTERGRASFGPAGCHKGTARTVATSLTPLATHGARRQLPLHVGAIALFGKGWHTTSELCLCYSRTLIVKAGDWAARCLPGASGVGDRQRWHLGGPACSDERPSFRSCVQPRTLHRKAPHEPGYPG